MSKSSRSKTDTPDDDINLGLTTSTALASSASRISKLKPTVTGAGLMDNPESSTIVTVDDKASSTHIQQMMEMMKNMNTSMQANMEGINKKFALIDKNMSDFKNEVLTSVKLQVEQSSTGLTYKTREEEINEQKEILSSIQTTPNIKGNLTLNKMEVPVKSQDSRATISSLDGRVRHKHIYQVDPNDDVHESSSSIARGSLKDDKHDRRIDDEVNVGTLPIDDLAIWAQTREECYPYYHNLHLYTSCYTLLSENGRTLEYIRFADKVNFDPRLYPRYLLSHVNYLLEQKGMPVGKRVQRNRVTVDQINTIPGIDRIKEENHLRVRNGWDNDLMLNTMLYDGLPQEVVTGNGKKPDTMYTMMAAIEIYVNKRYTLYLGKLENVYEATSDEKRAAAMLPKKYYGPSSSVIKYESINDDYLGLPSLDDPYSDASAASIYNKKQRDDLVKKREYETGILSDYDGMEYLKQLVGDDSVIQLDIITRATINSIFNKRTLTTSETIKVVQDLTSKSSSPAPFTGFPMEKAPQFYMDLLITICRYLLPISDIITIIGSKLEASAKSWFNSELVLISTCTQGVKIPTLLKSFRRQYMGKQLINQLYTKLLNNKLFSLPATLEELTLHYTAWNTTKVALCLCEPSHTDTSLMYTFLTSFPPMITAGIPHNGDGLTSINEAWNNISRTAAAYYDRSKTLQTYKQLQVAAKVKSESNVIISNPDDTNGDYSEIRDEGEQSYTHYHAVQSAHRSFSGQNEYDRYMNENESSESDNDDCDNSQITWFHALKLTRNIPKRDIECWHCGNKGHVVGECDVAKQGLPQTAKGQFVWAKINKMRGEGRPYDVKYQMLQYKKYRARLESRNANDNRTYRSPYPRDINNSSRNTNRDITIVDEDDDSDTSSTIEEDDIEEKRKRLQKKKPSNNKPSTVSSTNAIYTTSDIDISDEEQEYLENSEVVTTNKKVIINVSSVGVNDDEFREVETREKLSASSICLPIEIIPNGVEESIPVGYAY